MSGSKSLFKDLDEKEKGEVRLGDDKQVPIEGRGTVAIKTIQGDVKLIHDVQYVPSLAHSLLSVGQLMASGYSIVFNNKTCAIADKKSGHTIALIRMTQNKMFPLDVSNDVGSALVAKSENDTRLWHFRYGHLNVKSLKTPFEAWRGKKPWVRHLKVFGCVAYALVTSNLRRKLDSKSEKNIFIGYCTETKAYKLYDPVNGKVTVSRDVKFNEEERWIWDTNENPSGMYFELTDHRHEEPEQNGSSNSWNTSEAYPFTPKYLQDM
ncbi:hypothetical protein SASPL_134779 [Salvia splendens]|uniref:GAG-pre-integrase domain-containing protein n=1 Tax=Salvia splendens TaxID=180675 RepID=A0A8X8ZEU9_SALSN|nr:hypothetical protein SASPL_134779 [Salvia splendens]